MTRVVPHSGRKYRTDIDGLRAVAVLLVVLEHLGFNTFSGGYVGVDVFFVISGFLIGASLISDVGQGAFSLVDFYERRIRRIFPALLTMLMVVTALSYRYLLPWPFTNFCRSLLAATLSVSNILFWHESGYFDQLSVTKPLLHTWSLGVEEQFYIFFPLLLLIVFRYQREKLRLFLWLSLLISFSVAVWTVRFSPSVAFFWAPLRAWELAIGALVSQHSFQVLSSRRLREVAAGLGALLIIVPGISYTPSTLFPGLAAVPPCIGAALFIAAGMRGPSGASRLLSVPPLAFVGLISYSLYLWHWPLIVFQRTAMLFSAQPMTAIRVKASILIAAFLMAILSWYFIEVPFRKGGLRPERKPLFVLNGVSATAIMIFAIVVIRGRGIPQRFPPSLLKVISPSNDHTSTWNRGTCFLETGESFSDFRPDQCLRLSPDQKNVLVYGDSTAADLYSGLVRVYPDVHFMQATVSACRAGLLPVPGDHGNCEAFKKFVDTVYLPKHHPDSVILAGAWREEEIPAVGEELQRIRSLGIKVVLMGPVIEFDQSLPDLVAVEMMRRDSPEVRSERLTLHESPNGHKVEALMGEEAKRTWHVGYVSYFRQLCTGSRNIGAFADWETRDSCPVLTQDGEALLFDNLHLTLSGSVAFAKALRAQGEYF